MKRANTLFAITLLLVACGPAVPTPGPRGSASPIAPTPVQPVALRIVSEEGEVRYRVREQLATLPLPSEVLGSTNEVSGSVLLTGASFDRERSKITIDLRNLKTDRIQRDRFVQRELLKTAEFQNATFVPKELKGINGGLPTSGEAQIEVVGAFTVKDQTRELTWKGTARFDDLGVMANVSTTTSFSEMGLTKPSVAIVLSVDDNFTLEADLRLVRGDDEGAGGGAARRPSRTAGATASDGY